MKPSPPIFDHVSAQLVQASSCSELVSHRSGDPRPGESIRPRLYFHERPTAGVRSFEALKSVVRVLVKLVWLFPALLVLKLALWLAGIWYGDLITVAFVGLLVVFFLLLGILVLLYAFVGPPSVRKRKIAHIFRLPDADDFDEALRRLGCAGANPTRAEELARLTGETGPTTDQAVRFRGRIDAGHDVQRGAVVLRDTWHEADETVARLTIARAFAVVAEGDDAPTTVVVRFESAPWVLGEYRSSDEDPLHWNSLPETLQRQLMAWLAEESASTVLAGTVAAGESCALRQGDEVEVVAASYEVIPNLDDLIVEGRHLRLGDAREAKGGGPYRQAGVERGLLLTSSVRSPVLLHKAS